MTNMYTVEGMDHAFAAPGAATSTVVYDDRALPVEAIFHDAQQALVLRILLSRDNDGRLLTEAVYSGADAPLADSSAEIDSVPPEGRQKLAALLADVFADRTFSTTTYRYDQPGRLEERTVRMGSLSEERTTFRLLEHRASDDCVSLMNHKSHEVHEACSCIVIFVAFVVPIAGRRSRNHCVSGRRNRHA